MSFELQEISRLRERVELLEAIAGDALHDAQAALAKKKADDALLAAKPAGLSDDEWRKIVAARSAPQGA